jgi:hypothetical protein
MTLEHVVFVLLGLFIGRFGRGWYVRRMKERGSHYYPREGLPHASYQIAIKYWWGARAFAGTRTERIAIDVIHAIFDGKTKPTFRVTTTLNNDYGETIGSYDTEAEVTNEIGKYLDGMTKQLFR